MAVTFNYAAIQREKSMRNTANRLATGDFMGAPSYRAIRDKSGPRGVRGRGVDVRNMLMTIGGVGSFNAELLIPQMFLAPRTTDPDAQSTILTIEGLQRGMNKAGAKLDINGVLTPATVQALRRASGASWMSKTWVQLYGDVAETLKRGRTLAAPPTIIETDLPTATGAFDAFTSVPVAALGAGALLLFFALKGK